MGYEPDACDPGIERVILKDKPGVLKTLFLYCCSFLTVILQVFLVEEVIYLGHLYPLDGEIKFVVFLHSSHFGNP